MVDADPSGTPDGREIDQLLVGRVVAGNLDALAELYDRYKRSAFGLARRICADDGLAEDVVQEAFVTFWANAGRYNPERAALGPWLLAIVRNAAIERRRREAPTRRRPVPAGDDGWSVTPGPGTGELTFGAIAPGQIRDALEALPAEQREAVALPYYGGYTQREAADRLGLPVGTVKSCMFTGMRSLRRALLPAVDDVAADRAGGAP